MANITIYMKGPDFAGTPPAQLPDVTISQIPNNVSFRINQTYDLGQYINDPGGRVTDSRVLTGGSPLPDPWFVSYSHATKLLTGDAVGQAQSLTLEVTFT